MGWQCDCKPEVELRKTPSGRRVSTAPHEAPKGAGVAHRPETGELCLHGLHGVGAGPMEAGGGCHARSLGTAVADDCEIPCGYS